MKIGLGNFIRRSVIAGISAGMMILAGCDHDSLPDGDGYLSGFSLIFPRSIVENTNIPVVIAETGVNPRNSVWSIYNISGVEMGVNVDFYVKRGRGSVSFNGLQGREFILFAPNNSISPVLSFNIQIKPRTQMRELAGILSGGDLLWDSTQVICLVDDVVIPAGNTLIVESGTTVLFGYLVSAAVNGLIEVRGTADYPVYFTSSDSSQPWGEIFHQNSTGHYSYVFFTNGGGDNSKPFGHSGSQPVIAGDHCNLTLTNVYIIDNPGKALGLTSSVVEMDSCLISRCDTGGELITTLAKIDNSYFLDMPNGDNIEIDDDNDCLYLLNAWADGSDTSVIANCVFASGKDDGIDHNGAILKIDNCIIEDFDNEGVAASNKNGVLVFNTLIVGCEQGIEAGYGSPQVSVNHCTLIDNQNGLRFGDWYNWGCYGSLTAVNTVVFNSSLHNVWNFDVLLGEPKAGALNVYYSLVNQSEYDTSAGCITGIPLFDSEFELIPDSPGYNAGSDGMSMGILFPF